MVYVAETSSFDKSSNIFDNARVEDFADVFGAQIKNNAIVSGYAQINYSGLKDNSKASGYARVDYSDLLEDSQVSDHSKIWGATLGGSAIIYGNAVISGVNVRDTSCVFGDASLDGGPWGNNIFLAGSCKFGGKANFDGLVTFEDFVVKYGADRVKQSGEDLVLTDVWDMG